MQITAFDVARRFLGVREVAGTFSNPLILAMLQLHNEWPEDDEVAWCSAFAAFPCFILGVRHSESLLARSWLNVGYGIPIEMARPGFDVVILKRGSGHQPGPENTTAPGHVGYYAGHDDTSIRLLGGNQGDRVSLASFSRDRVLGIRRLHDD